MNMAYRLVMADVDGTLIMPGGKPAVKASDELIRSVAAVKKKGVSFSLATARSWDWVERLVNSLELDSYLILDNGARIYDCQSQKYIFESFIEEEKAKQLAEELTRAGSEVIIVNSKERFVYKSSENKKVGDVVKMMVLHVTPFEAQEINEQISTSSGLSVTKSVSGINPIRESVHITNKKARKELALGRIVDLMGISLDAVIGIGDSYNDFSFLAACGLKVAMGNAVAEIKSIADYVAPSYEENGVVTVLEKFILEKGKTQ